MAVEIVRVEEVDLEKVFYGTAIKVAERLSKDYPAAAVKVYRAQGVRILKESKSKCYAYAVDYFRKARDLYLRLGLEDEWLIFVGEVTSAHQRKPAFISRFSDMVNGLEKPSFESRARQKWQNKISV